MSGTAEPLPLALPQRGLICARAASSGRRSPP